MTKKEERMLHGYNWSMGYYGQRGLEDCYSSPSIYKWRAYHNCIEDEKALGGFNGTVVGYNCMMFSYAFRYYVTSEVTGEILEERLRYYTKDYTYDFKVA